MAIYEIKLTRRKGKLVQTHLDHDATHVIRRRINEVEPGRRLPDNLKEQAHLEQDVMNKDHRRLTAFEKVIKARRVAKDEHRSDGHAGGEAETEPLIILSRKAGDQMLWSVVDEAGRPVPFKVSVHPHPDDPDPYDSPLAGFPKSSSGCYVLSGVPVEEAVSHHFLFKVVDQTNADNDPDWYAVD